MQLTKFQSRENFMSKAGPFFWCKCGMNPTHTTPDCWILKWAEAMKAETPMGRLTMVNGLPSHCTIAGLARKHMLPVARRPARKARQPRASRDECLMDLSGSSASDEVTVNSMEFELDDQVGTLGLEGLQNEVKQEPKDRALHV